MIDAEKGVFRPLEFHGEFSVGGQRPPPAMGFVKVAATKAQPTTAI